MLYVAGNRRVASNHIPLVSDRGRRAGSRSRPIRCNESHWPAHAGREMLPVFGGISGSQSATCSIRGLIQRTLTVAAFVAETEPCEIGPSTGVLESPHRVAAILGIRQSVARYGLSPGAADAAPAEPEPQPHRFDSTAFLLLAIGLARSWPRSRPLMPPTWPATGRLCDPPRTMCSDRPGLDSQITRRVVGDDGVRVSRGVVGPLDRSVLAAQMAALVRRFVGWCIPRAGGGGLRRSARTELARRLDRRRAAARLAPDWRAGSHWSFRRGAERSCLSGVHSRWLLATERSPDFIARHTGNAIRRPGPRNPRSAHGSFADGPTRSPRVPIHSGRAVTSRKAHRSRRELVPAPTGGNCVWRILAAADRTA